MPQIHRFLINILGNISLHQEIQSFTEYILLLPHIVFRATKFPRIFNKINRNSCFNIILCYPGQAIERLLNTLKLN